MSNQSKEKQQSETQHVATQADRLQRPFPIVLLKEVRGKTYLPIAEAIARMNDVIGVGDWRVEVIETRTFGDVETAVGDFPSQIVCHVRVHVLLDGSWVAVEGFGGSSIELQNARVQVANRSVSKGLANDLGDSFKAAMSDATKKALQFLGVGLDLARVDEAKAYEQNNKELRAQQQIDQARQSMNRSSNQGEQLAVEQSDQAPSHDQIIRAVAQLQSNDAKDFAAFRREFGLPGNLKRLSDQQRSLLWFDFLVSRT